MDPASPAGADTTANTTAASSRPRVAERRTLAPLAAEAVGTLLFFFVGAGSIVTATAQQLSGQPSAGLLGVALAHGLALAVLVSALGAVSGAHFNPAVTVAVWTARRLPGT